MTRDRHRPGPMARALTVPLIGAVYLYRVTLSPIIGGQCRYTPTCSQYALDALRAHGPVRGSLLAARRILRCHPFARGGYDPAPLKNEGAPGRGRPLRSPPAGQPDRRFSRNERVAARQTEVGRRVVRLLRCTNFARDTAARGPKILIGGAMSRMPAEQRREQLLDCAAELFATQGYAKATTSQLAKSAGVTEPIIYRHFSSKRDLFVALIERTGRRTLDQWSEHLASAANPAERVRRLIGDNPMVSSEGRVNYRVFLQAISEVENDEKIAKAVNAHITRVHAFLRDEITAAQSAHQMPKRFSADVLAWVMINVGMGYGVLSALGMEGHGKDADGVHVQQVLARAMVGKGAEKPTGDGNA